MTTYVFPGESTAYEQKRQELLAAETSLRDQVERVAQLRRALPLGKAVPDYVFREGPADLSCNNSADFRDVKLSELFAHGHDELIVVHLMFAANDELVHTGFLPMAHYLLAVGCRPGAGTVG